MHMNLRTLEIIPGIVLSVVASFFPAKTCWLEKKL